MKRTIAISDRGPDHLKASIQETLDRFLADESPLALAAASVPAPAAEAGKIALSAAARK